MMINYRIQPEGNSLKEEDYKLLSDGTRYGFGMDLSHYQRIRNARKKYNLDHLFERIYRPPFLIREDFIESWDAREGYNIEGEPLNTRPHPLHDIILLDKETKKKYLVDSVHKHHHFGFYITLLTRQEGTESHGVIHWENISCKDPSILEGIKEAHERFSVINKK